MFESHCIIISPICCVSLKEASCGCLPMGLCISPCAGIGQHVREVVKEHDIYYKSKSYKLKLLRNFLVQEYLITFILQVHF